MQLLYLLLGAIIAAPKIIDGVKGLIVLGEEWWASIKKDQARRDFDAGAAEAQEDKNTCDLEKAFNPDKKC